jgi:hypothetical protein
MGLGIVFVASPGLPLHFKIWSAHLEERKKMMQQRGDYLDGLTSGVNILPCAKMAG